MLVLTIRLVRTLQLSTAVIWARQRMPLGAGGTPGDVEESEHNAEQGDDQGKKEFAAIVDS